MNAEPLHVVAAVIVNKGLILAGRRSKNKINHGFWEFPGGKVENGETSIQALKREIREELGLEIDSLRLLSDSVSLSNGQSIRLEAHICHLTEVGKLISTDHDLFKWLKISDLHNLNWCEPDLPAVDQLTRNPYDWQALFQKLEAGNNVS